MSEIIARVNGTPIDDKSLGAAMQGLAQEQFKATFAEVPAESRAELREMALQRLIARELIYQAALAEGLVASLEDVNAEKQRVIRLAGNPNHFWERLAERGMDEVAFDRMVRKDVTTDLMTARKLEDIPEPDNAEIEAFFREHPEQLQRPERVRVSHILFAVDPEAPQMAMDKALEVKEQAIDGDFAALAKEHSICPSAPGGGELGYIRREDVDPTFADAVFGLPVGAIAGPFKTPFGLHLVMVKERDLPGPPTLDESRPRIIEVLKRIRGGRLLETWVDELRRSAEVAILP